MTLCPMFHKDPNGGISEAIWLKGVGSKDRFCQCLESMPRDSIEEEKNIIFSTYYFGTC